MGIQGLTKLLGDHAPKSIKEQSFNNYFGRKIAVDASMHIYQFLAVVGRQGDQLLSNEAGEVTSHLQGMFYRTARMLEAGVWPAGLHRLLHDMCGQCSRQTVTSDADPQYIPSPNQLHREGMLIGQAGKHGVGC